MGALLMEVIIGAVIAVLITIGVEYLRRPNLKLIIETPPVDVEYPSGRPAQRARYLRLKLINKALPTWAAWMVRAPALQCRGSITFHHLDGQNVFGREMTVRWAGSPEPVPIQAIAQDRTQIQIFDPMRLTLESRMDVYPGEGEGELVDIAARLDDDNECYGWNNETYFCITPWRNPDWRLSQGRYLVKVVIKSSAQRCTGVFRLINDMRRRDFRLEQAHPIDRAAVLGTRP
jgi:hypothetical protein